ncbi:MAG: efflux RND transporter periplasmic adaptor subunit [Kiritimatiellia bacterium]|nr:efflux RND transporter periplasmic adaptor subunit [Kiritimatiellia bacterium]
MLYRVLPPALVLAAIAVSVILVKTRPRAIQKPPAERVAQVSLMPLAATAEPIHLQAAGTVIPARQVSLKPRVSGEVIWLHPRLRPGGRIAEGDELFRLDDSDYRLALETRRSELAQAELAFKLELGQQDIARHEWALIEDRTAATGLDQELTLRKPHLRSAEARLKSAQAALERAELDLARTRIRAPFNGVVLDREAEVGEQVSPQTQLARIVGTDVYWVEATLPADHLRWIEREEAEGRGGSEAIILPAGGIRSDTQWTGRVIEIQPALETQGRMARILIAVRQPLDSESSAPPPLPLLLGAYVRVQILGPLVSPVFRLPVTALHDGHRVWILSDGRLEIRSVEPFWRDSQSVLIREGLAEGERLVVSNIAAPVPGMRLEEERPLTSFDERPAEGAKTP